jgi:hypothetical protein
MANISNVRLNVTLRPLRVTITQSECAFVALFIHYANRMCHFILSFVAGLSAPYCPTLLKEKVRFPGKNLLNINVVFLFYLQILFETNVSENISAGYYHKCT